MRSGHDDKVGNQEILFGVSRHTFRWHQDIVEDWHGVNLLAA
jgi:hypothetical protein